MKNLVKLNHFVWFIGCFFFLIFAYSCEQENEDYWDEEITPQADVNDPLIKHIDALGFDISTIQDLGDYYLVEEDVIFIKSEFEYLTSNLTPEQASTNALVSGGNVTNITVRIAGNMPTSGTDNWRTAIQNAINAWNNISCSQVHFQLTTSTNARITISSDNGALGNNVLAAASFPANGNPGSTIRVNLDFLSNRTMTESQKLNTSIHELGHCIGFRHTNWLARGEGTGSVGANQISGTPATDGSSVMNGGTALNSWAGFSNGDLTATRNLYSPGTLSCPAPLYRYWGNSDHFYTANFAELGAGRGGWALEGIQCRIFKVRVSGTVPLYRYWNGSGTDHFYTTNYNELGSGGGGYVYEGVAGYIYSSSGSGRLPLYRYYSGSGGDHFYTTSFSELGSGGSGYVYEGVQGYVLPR